MNKPSFSGRCPLKDVPLRVSLSLLYLFRGLGCPTFGIGSVDVHITRRKRDIFQQRFFEGALSSGGALAIEEINTGRIIGSSRYYEWSPDTRDISIGYTFLSQQHWGVGTNREMKDLMLEHVYQWARAVWFHVGKSNMRSRYAVEKLGAMLSYEKERELGGKPYTQLYYKLEASKFCP